MAAILADRNVLLSTVDSGPGLAPCGVPRASCRDLTTCSRGPDFDEQHLDRDVDAEHIAAIRALQQPVATGRHPR